jgi:hypothetical protein
LGGAARDVRSTAIGWRAIACPSGKIVLLFPALSGITFPMPAKTTKVLKFTSGEK